MTVRRTVICLLALTVFLPSLASASTFFRCDVDLIVRESCCCPPKKAKRPADVPTMQRECCKFEKHTAAAPPTATAVRAQALTAPAATAVAIGDVMPPLREVANAIAPRAQAPPPERSLLAQHCALLV